MYFLGNALNSPADSAKSKHLQLPGAYFSQIRVYRDIILYMHLPVRDDVTILFNCGKISTKIQDNINKELSCITKYLKANTFSLNIKNSRL